jgi:chaperonin GroES
MIKPLFDRVLAAPTDEQKSIGGIYLPQTQAERSQIMQVTAVGDVKNVSVGDRIIINKYSGAEINYGGAKQYIIKETDILAVIYE